MTRAILIDDEPHCLERLSQLLAEYCAATVQVVGRAQSVEEGIQLINTVRPSLIFLDVQLHEQTGFDLLRQIEPVRFSVIFTTAFDRYAVQAFKFSALDYLLKPIDPDDLQQAVAKLTSKPPPDLSGQLDALLHNLQQQQETHRRICVPVSSGFVFLAVNDIIRCQSDGNYTTIFLKNNQKLVAAKTLKEFDKLLSDAHFFRIHQSHLINLAYLKSYQKGAGGSVTMIDNTELDVSTRRKDDFLKRMLSR
ncbi:LytR/AlgR family response regulator transcription factor [Fibrella aquatilis]|uniref:Response regulator transcription factor n=1 Tax=Fibrella aquatilis TaxID=2817059 RepID=A0A939G8K3_9BACT|nr:LytTR family DNA-binding domain-containing protein [Fibrella aquatilis]MBO0934422.1 response regulator transcription factor [Fibrella aquatilis]